MDCRVYQTIVPTTDSKSSGKLAKLFGPSTSSRSLSILDSLRALHTSDLGRKRQVKENPARGKQKHCSGIIAIMERIIGGIFKEVQNRVIGQVGNIIAYAGLNVVHVYFSWCSIN